MSYIPAASRQKSGGKLTDKYLQSFISHNKGGQYYIGTLKEKKFYPSEHERFTWKDNACFAPEAMLDNKNCQIIWFWYLDNIKGEYISRDWVGVYSFPRILWYDGGLKMAPADELERLQYNDQRFDVGMINGTSKLPVKNGASMRIRAEITAKEASNAGFYVLATESMSEFAKIEVDIANRKLKVSTSRTLGENRALCEEAPFMLDGSEILSLDILVDKSVIEVYANDRQTIFRRFYPTDYENAVNVFAFSDGADFGNVEAFEIMPTNSY